MESQRPGREQLLRLLSQLEGETGDWDTVYLRNDSLRARQTRPVFASDTDRRLLLVDSLMEDEHLRRELARYGTGLVLFHSSSTTYALAAPFPVNSDLLSSGKPDTKPLRQMMEQPHRIALVLVTWGAYVVALYRGTELQQFKRGSGHIHPPHKKGGSSQARFARRTEEQRREFLKRVGNRIDEEFGDEAVDYFFFGGNRLILRPLAGHSRFVMNSTTALAARILAVKRATRDALDGALAEAYSSLLFRN
jgi:hypothetical protein